jgi:hypothetical protein
MDPIRAVSALYKMCAVLPLGHRNRGFESLSGHLLMLSFCVRIALCTYFCKLTKTVLALAVLAQVEVRPLDFHDQ